MVTEEELYKLPFSIARHKSAPYHLKLKVMISPDVAWLIPQSGGFIPVWEEGVLRYPVTQKQKAALRTLKMAGLYRGGIP